MLFQELMNLQGYHSKADKYLKKLSLLEIERTNKRRERSVKNKHPKRKIKIRLSKKKLHHPKKLTPFQIKYYEYLQSPEWIQIRIKMITAHPYCERCHSKFGLQVHHKTYKNIFHEEPDDLEVLYEKCHKAEHNIKKKPTRKKYRKNN